MYSSQDATLFGRCPTVGHRVRRALQHGATAQRHRVRDACGPARRPPRVNLGRTETKARCGRVPAQGEARIEALFDRGGICGDAALKGTLRGPGRRIGQRGDATRAPTQGPRPGRAAGGRPSAIREWSQSDKSIHKSQYHRLAWRARPFFPFTLNQHTLDTGRQVVRGSLMEMGAAPHRSGSMPRSLPRTALQTSSKAGLRPLRHLRRSPGSGDSGKRPQGTASVPRSLARRSASVYLQWTLSTRTMSESPRASTTRAVRKPPSTRSNSSRWSSPRYWREVLAPHENERRPPLLVADADIGASTDQKRRRLDPAEMGGAVKRR